MQRVDDLECNGLKIIQDTELYNFTIDPILLVNLSKIKENAIVVDLCSGGGIIPILVGGKSRAKKIYGIEIQKELCDLANLSLELNKQTDLVKIINDDIKNYGKYLSKGKTDVVFCNPPYMKNESTFTSENVSRTIARQELKVSLEDCVKVGSELLKFGGVYYMVHQIKRLQEIMMLFSKYGLAIKNVCAFKAKVENQPHLVVVRAVKGGKLECNEFDEIVINNEDGTLTDYVKALYAQTEI